MGPVELFAGVAVLVGLAGVVWLVFRLHGQYWKSREWPRVDGRIQTGIVEESSGESDPTCHCLFQYAYTVDGLTRSGLFVLPVESAADGKQLLLKVQGRTVQVKYDPRDPKFSFLEERVIEGIGVWHGPQYVNFARDLDSRYLNSLDLTGKTTKKD